MVEKVSVILPTYNERESLPALLREIVRILTVENLNYQLVVVDDNSPDGTAAVIKEMVSEIPEIKLIVRKNERGLASAIRTGFEQSDGDVLVVMDTDFNHNPAIIPLLVYVTRYFDIAIGSRYVAGGGMDTSKLRYLFSLIFNLFIRVSLNMGTKDNLSGFLGVRRSVLDGIDYDHIFYGYGDYCIRFLYRAKLLGLKILEVPVVYNVRRGGESKTNFIKHLLQYTQSVLKLRAGIGNGKKK